MSKTTERTAADKLPSIFQIKIFFVVILSSPSPSTIIILEGNKLAVTPI